MPKKTGGNLMGAWAFLIGVILAVIFGFITAAAWLTWLVLILGIIIGLLTLTIGDVKPFLLAGLFIVLVTSFGLGLFAVAVPKFGIMLTYMLMLFVPATIIMALKSVFSAARG